MYLEFSVGILCLSFVGVLELVLESSDGCLLDFFSVFSFCGSLLVSGSAMRKTNAEVNFYVIKSILKLLMFS